jgi:hypothetical protein
MVATAYPAAGPWAGLVGLGYAAAAVLFLKGFETALRQRAAAIQEQFDCHVLELPWNGMAVEEPPAPETVAGAAGDTEKSSESLERLKDSYSVEVDAVPLSAARLICQRANLHRDSDLRKPYAVLLAALAIAAPMVLIIWSLASGQEVATLLVLLAAGLPLVMWAGQEARTHNEAADRAQRLRRRGDGIWRDLIAEVLRQPTWERIDEGRYLNASRSLQDQIYIHRCDSPTVPAWFYRRSRENQEREMNAAARELAAEFQRARRA